jgi:phosphopantetheinyl transferase
MSLQQIIKENNIKIGLWEIEESLEELLQLTETTLIPNCNNEKRKKEFLVIRLLLNNISPNSSITYNKFGAPELNNFQNISISHSKGLVAILLGNKKVGLDIEQISDKPLKLSSKFIAKDVYENLSKEKATLIWCAKEAIYKWYQKGNIDFIKDIKLHNFEIAEKGILTAEFKTERLFLNYQKINNHYLVYVCK